MKTTVEITRDALLDIVADSVAIELSIATEQMHNPKLQLSKTSRGQHVFTFDTEIPAPNSTISPDQ